MRGPAAVTSWSPSKLAALDDDTLQRITDLYASDPLLAKRLADALAADEICDAQVAARPAAHGRASTGMKRGRAATASTKALATDALGRDCSRSAMKRQAGGARYGEVINAAAGFLRREDGPQVAVFDTIGWDTHANEGSAARPARRPPRRAGRRTAHAEGTARPGLEGHGCVWPPSSAEPPRSTALGAPITARVRRRFSSAAPFRAAVSSPIGPASRRARCIRGAICSRRSIFESVLKGVLQEHLLVPYDAVESSVFPDSGSAKALKGLIRT